MFYKLDTKQTSLYYRCNCNPVGNEKQLCFLPNDLSINYEEFLTMLSNFIQQARNKLNELKNEALKYKSKEFLNAALGGSAMVIMADGTIDPQEKIKMMAFIENHEALSIYDTSEVVKTWKDYIDTLEMDVDIGNSKAMTALGKIKGKEEQAKLVLRMVCAIGAADGDFDADEKRVAADIAKELGLNPVDFDLA